MLNEAHGISDTRQGKHSSIKNVSRKSLNCVSPFPALGDIVQSGCVPECMMLYLRVSPVFKLQNKEKFADWILLAGIEVPGY